MGLVRPYSSERVQAIPFELRIRRALALVGQRRTNRETVLIYLTVCFLLSSTLF